MASIGSGRSNSRIGRAGEGVLLESVAASLLHCLSEPSGRIALEAKPVRPLEAGNGGRLPVEQRRMRRHGGHRELRDMRVLRHQPRTRGAARSARRAGRSDAPVPRAAVLVRPASPVCTGSQRSVTSAESRTTSKPKPGSQASPSAASRSSNSCAHARGIAQRRAGADLEPMHLAVGAEQRHLDQPRALAAPLQHVGQVRAPDARWCRARRLRARSARRSAARPWHAGSGRRGVIGSSQRPSA